MKFNKGGMEIKLLARLVLAALLLIIILYFLAKASPLMFDKIKSIFKFW